MQNLKPIITKGRLLTEEEALAELEALPDPQNTIDVKPSIVLPSVDAAYNPAGYIILPGRTHGNYSYPDLVVSIDKYHDGLNWDQCHEELNKEGYHMQNLRQFVDFLNLLRSGDVNDGTGTRLSSDRIQALYKEIMEVRVPYRAEWLDAKFTEKDKEWFTTYHRIKQDGTLEEVKEPLEECLREDKTPGISLDHWLSNATKQGLPDEKTKKGDLYYWCPRNGFVVRFWAGSDRAGFICNGNPLFSFGGFGVRRQKFFP